MKIKSLGIFKIIAIILSFLLVFEQSGFAQVAGELDISSHFLALRNSFSQERFRPLHLRYLSYDPGANNFNLLLDKGDFLKGLSPKDKAPKPIGWFDAPPSAGAVPEEVLQQETKTLLNYFFIGISLSNEAFWVNLRPDSPNNIIDPEVAETDVGRILLEADLQLKKDTANFTSPLTPEGKDYWDKLYKRAEELYGDENITIPTLTRPWIVPDEIIIRESPDNAYIYKATLKVMLEQDYLKDSSVYSFQDQRSKALNEYSSQLIRETIIPKLTKEINSAKRYAPLRQVYYSLILAQWFKQKFYGKSGLYSYLIDKHKLDGLTSKTPWSKTTYFNSYKASFQQGEYNIKEPRYTPYGQTIRSYMSGGIAFGEMPGAFVPIKSNPRMPRPLFIWNQSSIIEMNARKLVPGAQALGEIKDLWGLDIKSIGPAVRQEPVVNSPGELRVSGAKENITVKEAKKQGGTTLIRMSTPDTAQPIDVIANTLPMSTLENAIRVAIETNPDKAQLLEAFLERLLTSPPNQLLSFSGILLPAIVSEEYDLLAFNLSALSDPKILVSAVESISSSPISGSSPLRNQGALISQQELSQVYWGDIASVATELIDASRLLYSDVKEGKKSVAQRNFELKAIIAKAIERISAHLAGLAKTPGEKIEIEKMKKDLIVRTLLQNPAQLDFAIAMAAFVGEQMVSNGNGRYANVYFPRDGALFFISEKVIGMLNGQNRDPKLYHISRATFKDYYNWMSQTVGELDSPEYRNKSADFAINALKEKIEEKMKIDAKFKVQIANIIADLKRLGIIIDKNKKDSNGVRFVDTGFKTFPLMFCALMKIDDGHSNTDRLVQVSHLPKNILPQLDTGSWRWHVRSWISKIKAFIYAKPSISYSEDAESFLQHPFEAGNDGSMRMLAPALQLRAYWIQLLFVLGAIQYHDQLTEVVDELQKSGLSKVEATQIAVDALKKLRPAFLSPQPLNFNPANIILNIEEAYKGKLSEDYDPIKKWLDQETKNITWRDFSENAQYKNFYADFLKSTTRNIANVYNIDILVSEKILNTLKPDYSIDPGFLNKEILNNMQVSKFKLDKDLINQALNALKDKELGIKKKESKYILNKITDWAARPLLLNPLSFDWFKTENKIKEIKIELNKSQLDKKVGKRWAVVAAIGAILVLMLNIKGDSMQKDIPADISPAPAIEQPVGPSAINPERITDMIPDKQNKEWVFTVERHNKFGPSKSTLSRILYYFYGTDNKAQLIARFNSLPVVRINGNVIKDYFEDPHILIHPGEAIILSHIDTQSPRMIIPITERALKIKGKEFPFNSVAAIARFYGVPIDEVRFIDSQGNILEKAYLKKEGIVSSKGRISKKAAGLSISISNPHLGPESKITPLDRNKFQEKVIDGRGQSSSPMSKTIKISASSPLKSIYQRIFKRIVPFEARPLPSAREFFDKLYAHEYRDQIREKKVQNALANLEKGGKEQIGESTRACLLFAHYLMETFGYEERDLWAQIELILETESPKEMFNEFYYFAQQLKEIELYSAARNRIFSYLREVKDYKEQIKTFLSIDQRLRELGLERNDKAKLLGLVSFDAGPYAVKVQFKEFLSMLDTLEKNLQHKHITAILSAIVNTDNYHYLTGQLVARLMNISEAITKLGKIDKLMNFINTLKKSGISETNIYITLEEMFKVDDPLVTLEIITSNNNDNALVKIIQVIERNWFKYNSIERPRSLYHAILSALGKPYYSKTERIMHKIIGSLFELNNFEIQRDHLQDDAFVSDLVLFCKIFERSGGSLYKMDKFVELIASAPEAKIIIRDLSAALQIAAKEGLNRKDNKYLITSFIFSLAEHPSRIAYFLRNENCKPLVEIVNGLLSRKWYSSNIEYIMPLLVQMEELGKIVTPILALTRRMSQAEWYSEEAKDLLLALLQPDKMSMPAENIEAMLRLYDFLVSAGKGKDEIKYILMGVAATLNPTAKADEFMEQDIYQSIEHLTATLRGARSSYHYNEDKALIKSVLATSWIRQTAEAVTHLWGVLSIDKWDLREKIDLLIMLTRQENPPEAIQAFTSLALKLKTLGLGNPEIVGILLNLSPVQQYQAAQPVMPSVEEPRISAYKPAQGAKAIDIMIDSMQQLGFNNNKIIDAVSKIAGSYDPVQSAEAIVKLAAAIEAQLVSNRDFYLSAFETIFLFFLENNAPTQINDFLGNNGIKTFHSLFSVAEHESARIASHIEAINKLTLVLLKSENNLRAVKNIIANGSLVAFISLLDTLMFKGFYEEGGTTIINSFLVPSRIADLKANAEAFKELYELVQGRYNLREPLVLYFSQQLKPYVAINEFLFNEELRERKIAGIFHEMLAGNDKQGLRFALDYFTREGLEHLPENGSDALKEIRRRNIAGEISVNDVISILGSSKNQNAEVLKTAILVFQPQLQQYVDQVTEAMEMLKFPQFLMQPVIFGALNEAIAQEKGDFFAAIRRDPELEASLLDYLGVIAQLNVVQENFTQLLSSMRPALKPYVDRIKISFIMLNSPVFLHKHFFSESFADILIQKEGNLLEAINDAPVVKEEFFHFLENSSTASVWPNRMEMLLEVFQPALKKSVPQLKALLDSLAFRHNFLIRDILAGDLNEILLISSKDNFTQNLLGSKQIPKEVKLKLLNYLYDAEFIPALFDVLLMTLTSNIDDIDVFGRTTEVIGKWFMESQGQLSLPAEVIANMRKVVSGEMDIDDPGHLFANYLVLARDLETAKLKRVVSYRELYDVIERVKNGQEVFSAIDVPEAAMLNIRALACEAFFMRNKILLMQQRAKALGRQIIVVANMSYGGVAVAPITEERQGQTFISGENIPVWHTKVGSTESHNNEFVLLPNLFTDEQIKVLLAEQPFIAVVDGTTSVASADRSSPHVPDAYKGYRNYLIVLNQALFDSVNPADFEVDEEFVHDLIRTSEAQELIQRIKGIGLSIKPRAPNKEYNLKFWYERRKSDTKEEYLYFRKGKKPTQDYAEKITDSQIAELETPTCLFIQSAIHPEDIEQDIKDNFIGGDHSPAYFDDQDHFKQFYLDYEEGYGVVFSKRYAYVARKTFREFMQDKGFYLFDQTVFAKQYRPIETVVLDLDGTLTQKSGVKLSNGVARNINALLEAGVRVVIMTDDIEANVVDRLSNLKASPRLIVFTDGGARGYTFNSDGSNRQFTEYNEKNMFETQERNKILTRVNELLSQTDWRLGEVTSYRIELRDISNRTEVIRQIKDSFEREGISAKVYKFGRHGLRITFQHKENAMEFLINAYRLDKSKILIVADSARSHQIDRALLTALPDSVSVNVGKFSPTIGKDNPNIVQFDRGGVGATTMLLSNVQLFKGLPDYLITPSSIGQPIDYEEQNLKAAASPLKEGAKNVSLPASSPIRNPTFKELSAINAWKTTGDGRRIWLVGRVEGSGKQLKIESLAKEAGRDLVLDSSKGYNVVAIEGFEKDPGVARLFVLKHEIDLAMMSQYQNMQRYYNLRDNGKRSKLARELLSLLLQDPQFSNYAIKLPEVHLIEIENKNNTESLIATEYINQEEYGMVVALKSRPLAGPDRAGEIAEKLNHALLDVFFGALLYQEDREYLVVKGAKGDELIPFDFDTSLAPLYYYKNGFDHGYNTSGFLFKGKEQEYVVIAGGIGSYVLRNKDKIMKMIREIWGSKMEGKKVTLGKDELLNVTPEIIWDFLAAQAGRIENVVKVALNNKTVKSEEIYKEAAEKRMWGSRLPADLRFISRVQNNPPVAGSPVAPTAVSSIFKIDFISEDELTKQADNVLFVGQNNFAISRGPLTTFGLFLCVGLILYDTKSRLAAVAHFDGDAASMPFLRENLKTMLSGMGMDAENLRAYIIGNKVTGGMAERGNIIAEDLNEELKNAHNIEAEMDLTGEYDFSSADNVPRGFMFDPREGKICLLQLDAENSKLDLPEKAPGEILDFTKSEASLSVFLSNAELSSLPVETRRPGNAGVDMLPEEAAKLIREASRINYEKWCLLSGRLEEAQRVLIKVPGRDSRGGHEFPLGEIAVALPILIKALIISGKNIEEIIVQCDSYPELIEALGEDKVKLVAAGQADDELRSIYSPDLVIDFDTVVLGEEIPENTVKFPVAKLWMSPDRYGAMREILGSAKLTIPEAGEAILKRERVRGGQITIFVNPHSDSNKNNNVDSWVGLIQELVSRGYKIVLNSGKEGGKDQAHTRNMLEKLKQEVESGDVKEFKGSINDLLNTFSKKIDGVITIDSGIFHVVHSLYSLPTVVFTTSNTLGWIPQKKEELLFERIKYVDFKYPSAVAEVLQNLLEKEKEGNAGATPATETKTDAAEEEREVERTLSEFIDSDGLQDKVIYSFPYGAHKIAGDDYSYGGLNQWWRVNNSKFYDAKDSFLKSLPVEFPGSYKSGYRIAEGRELIQSIDELFKNAYDAVLSYYYNREPPEGYKGEIRVSLSIQVLAKNEKMLVISITDNGAGKNSVPTEQKKESIFFRGQDNIGLRMAEKIIQDNGGIVDVEIYQKNEDAAGLGAKVELGIPLKSLVLKNKNVKSAGSPMKLDNSYEGLFNRLNGAEEINLQFSEGTSRKLKTRITGWMSGLKIRKQELNLFFTNNEALNEEICGKLNEFISGIAKYVEKRRSLVRPQEPLAVAEKILFTTVGFGHPYKEIDITSVPGAVRVYNTILAKSYNGKFRELMDEAMVRMQRILEVLNRVIEEGGIDLALAGRSGQEVVVVKKETMQRIYNEITETSSSPVEDEKGGIDMRSLSQHTVIQPMTGSNISKHGSSLKVAVTVPDKEWLDIEKMANSGITPSCERLREYLLSLQDPNSQIDKVLACIADILRQEEEKACCTESSLREILVLLESGRPANELKLALAKIEIFAKEPQLIEQ